MPRVFVYMNYNSSLSAESDPDLKFRHLEQFYDILFNSNLSSDFRPALSEYWTVQLGGGNLESTASFFQRIAGEIVNQKNIVGSDTNAMLERVRKISQQKLMASTTSISNACMYAQSITIPGESLTSAQVGTMPGTGSIIFPYVIDRRSPNNTIRIAFLDSNLCITDLVLRPWIHLCAKRGLVSVNIESGLSLDITARFIKPGIANVSREKGDNTSETLSVVSNTPPSIRKTFTFHKCVPISVNSQDYSYRGGGSVLRTAEFMYTRYTVN